MTTADLFLWILDNLNYWVVALFMAIESSFIPFPSEVVVPPAAWKAMDPNSGMSFILVIVFATIGADLGALINYYLAKWVGRPIIYRFADSRIGHMCLIDRQKVEVAEEYFRKHGAASTIFGRLVPAVRQLINSSLGIDDRPHGGQAAIGVADIHASEGETDASGEGRQRAGRCEQVGDQPGPATPRRRNRSPQRRRNKQKARSDPGLFFTSCRPPSRQLDASHMTGRHSSQR